MDQSIMTAFSNASGDRLSRSALDPALSPAPSGQLAGRQALMTTYDPLPIEFVRGKGAQLWDSDGRAYLDAVAGIAVTNVGHAHPRIVESVCDQANLILHTSNLYENTWQARLAERLSALSGMDRVFFANSGAEANEAAIKLARLHGHRRGVAAPIILVMKNAFHGRTMATLSASDSAPVRDGFGPLLDGFLALPFGDLEALDLAAKMYGERIVAVLVEPIQGESGVHLAPDGYLEALRSYCDVHHALLMLDEIQTGLGRTGKWFAFQHTSVMPDVMTLAKALGNGIAIGACLAHGESALLFGPGRHGSTFGGSPFACRVGCTVLDIIEEEGLVENAARQGAYLIARLRQALAANAAVRDVRGQGLMIGVEMAALCKPLMQRALDEHRLLINVTRQTTIRLLPPLILSTQECDAIVTALISLTDGAISTNCSPRPTLCKDRIGENENENEKE